MNHQEIKEFIELIGFIENQSNPNNYSKAYKSHSDFRININLSNNDLTKCTIDWGIIKLGRTTTSNFSQSENLVVIECVDRLLNSGYTPNSIVLEKSYSIAHGVAYLDVLVLKDSESYLMIECKTFGKEYVKEKKSMLTDGAQLFGYFVQDRKVEFLCLYASCIESNKIKSVYSAIETSRISGFSKSELFNSWDKVFFETGIFDKDSAPYNITEKKIFKKDLLDLTKNDGGKIFNEFAEILRRHVISDKPNAFNKIFNLFICKVLDEEKDDDEILDFQWASGESNETVLNRLNDLYKRGMLQFLSLQITDYNEKDLDNQINILSPSSKDEIRKIFTELRLYKNNEFAFKEVVNKKTFDENCNVIRDVVRLLQYKRIRYSTKQQFLGDFFEKLLNTSVKQETGQYFTPIPITKFICNALPIEKIITNKIRNHDDKFLPYAIDFASGSGHFLTEYMDRVDSIVKSTNEEGMRTSAKSNIKIWRDNYKWASEFVYGIEKDYRLAKTTKISCFLNGDGEANIIYGDGLDNFNNSNVYTGILKKDYLKQQPNTSVNSTDKSLNKFDVVIANPPYSVPGFKHTLNFGESSFDLFKYIDEKSGAIECFFIERAIQLLNDGGVAGVVLPISLLNNSGIYAETRKLLLEATKIKAIVEFGSGTFMATQTNTIVIFFEKRSEKDSIQFKEGVNQAFDKKEDGQIAEIKNAIDIYTNSIYDIDAADYFNIFEKFNFSIQSIDWLIDYFELFAPKNTNLDSLKDPKILESFKNFVIEKEKVKIHTYLLIHGQNLVVSQSPTVKREEKKFLGYEFSKRRGNEGIKISRNDDGSIKSTLYSEKNIDDQSKINFWIKSNFENNILTTSNHVLPNHTEILPFADLIDFSANFEAQINLSAISQKNYWESFNEKIIGKDSSNCSLIKIKDIEHVEVDSGNGAPQGDKYFEGGKHLFVRVSSLNINKNNEVHSDPVSMINESAIKDYNLKLFKKGTIVFPKSGKAIETNKIAILMSDCYVVSHLATIYIKNELIRDYVFNYLKHFKTSNLAKRSGYPTIGVAEIKKFKIPYPINNRDQTFTDWIASIKKIN